ncbi:MAG: hypothetical protein GXP22_03535 [Gammaproteobacteria bacterium]|nr:hypothetical protein [Gammaproteobacteria bacterium]
MFITDNSPSNVSQLKHIKSGILKQVIVNQTRVQQIQQTIAEGKYQFNLDRIATRIIAFESMVS